MFLLFEFGLGCSADTDDGNTTGELGQTFLEFLTVIITGGLVDLNADLLDAGFDLSVVAFATDDGGVVFIGSDLLSMAEVSQHNRFQFAAGLFRDNLGAGEDGNILQHSLAAITKTRGFDGEDVEHTTQFVQDQGGQCFAVDIFSDDDQVSFAGLDKFLEHRHDILGSRDLLVVDQNVRIRNDRFHLVGIGDEVRRNVTAVELHTFHVFLLEFQTFGFFNGDDAVFANLVHDLSDQLTDGGVLGGGSGNIGDIFASGDGNGLFLDGFRNLLGSTFNTVLDEHGVAASGKGLQTFIDNGVSQKCRGGGTIASDVVGLGGSLFDQLGAHVFKRVFQFDFFGNGHAIVSDGGGTKFAVDGHVAAFGAKGGDDSVCNDINTVLELSASIFAKDELFSRHRINLLLRMMTNYLVTIASRSLSRRMRSFLPSTLISVPPYLANKTVSLTATSMAMRLPFSSRSPGPMERTTPFWGFSLAVSGKTMPPAVTSFSSIGSTTTRLPNGFILNAILSSCIVISYYLYF
ncbi:hypothetical protein SDC9_94034 [bioreactor metagenome]|uniref:NAD-specific glutamate dehydrogenase n=1 Tax=bioreactor metagenome TaxID=1076179 RepID=A0A645A2B2_9ZZZZ